jgi:hypothetical protein
MLLSALKSFIRARIDSVRVLLEVLDNLPSDERRPSHHRVGIGNAGTSEKRGQ